MAQPATGSTQAAPEGAHGGGGFPPFQSETFASQLLWLAITFGLLYVLMSRVALPRVASVLEKRTARLANDLEEAQRLKTRSEEATEAYEKSLAEARNRAKAIAQETRDKLNAESDTRRKALEAELGAKLEGAEATLRTQTGQAMSNVRGIAVDTAAAIVERLTGRAPDRARIEAALDGAPQHGGA
jgi:F-type H+-transporting ATPase subunit b